MPIALLVTLLCIQQDGDEDLLCLLEACAWLLCVICVSLGNMYMGMEGGVPEVQKGTQASMFPSCMYGHLLSLC